MRSSKLWALALLGWLWPALALAQLITPASMRDANLTTTSTQNLVTTLNTFSAQRTLTIPGSGGLSSYYFQFVDTANAINGGNTLRIVAADGALINGSAALTVATAGAYVFIISSPSGYAATIVPPIASGSPGGTSGQVQYNNAGTFGGFTTSGDLTINTATGAGTLATVNANVGAFGSNVNCTTYTVNAKGLITAASQTACTPAISSITGLGTGIATALAINVGSAGAPVLFNGAGGTPLSLTLTNATGLPTTGLTGTLQAAQEPAHTGDVTNSAGSLAFTIAANVVTNAKAAQMATNTIKGNNTGGTANALDLTVPQVAAMFSAPVVSIFASGTAATYTTPTNAKYLIVKFQGGGGGGAGSGTTPGAGGPGGTTTFGTALLSAGGGGGGLVGNLTGATCSGGATSGGDINFIGGVGAAAESSGTRAGGAGGTSFFGGNGPAGMLQNIPGYAPAANTGSGGGGASAGPTAGAGGGGCAGGYGERLITSPLATYTYTVGVGGTAGTAGTSGSAGAVGAAGLISITAFFQ